MGLIDNFKNAFSRKPKVSNSSISVGDQTIEYVNELVKHTVKNSSAQVERIGETAIITYVPKQDTRYLARNTIIGSNMGRANTTKFTLVSDYDLARVERFYEKEGILRRFVVTATARAMRGEFSLVENTAYKGATGDAEKLFQELRRVLQNSKLTWNAIIQTSLKELYTYGNTFIRKYRANKKIESLLLDDPLFYRVIMDPKTLQIGNFVRHARLRPRAWSEDTFNVSKNHFGLYPQFVASDYMGRRNLAGLGYYGQTILTAPIPEVIPIEDVCHIKYMIEKNAPIAMPPSMPILNDIEDMRVLEENLVFLGWQFGHPILVATVDCSGLTSAEAESEINRVRSAIDNMESIGYIVATNRLKIELKYPNGSGIPLDSFIDHFTKRISKNMDTAALLMGDGGDAGRQAGEAIEASSNDIIWMTSSILAEKLQEEIIRDIWNGISSKDPIELPLKIRLVEIDRTRYMSYVNQLTNLVNAYVIPGSRLLDRIGEKPLSKDEKAEIDKFVLMKTAKASSGTVNPQNQHGEQTPGSVKN
jgi:hypothetical protein